MSNLSFLEYKNITAGKILQEAQVTAGNIARRQLYRNRAARREDGDGCYLLVCRSLTIDPQGECTPNVYCAVCGFDQEYVETSLALLGIEGYQLLAGVHLTLPVPELDATKLVIREVEVCDIRQHVFPGEKMMTYSALILAEATPADRSHLVMFKKLGFEHVEDQVVDYVQIVFYAHRFEKPTPEAPEDHEQ